MGFMGALIRLLVRAGPSQESWRGRVGCGASGPEACWEGIKFIDSSEATRASKWSSPPREACGDDSEFRGERLTGNYWLGILIKGDHMERLLRYTSLLFLKG